MRTFKTIVLCLVLSGLLLALSLRPQRPLFASSSATTFTVDTTDDRVDDSVSDGVCHTSVNTCALRAAIMQANHLTGPGVTTIILPAGTYTLTRPIVNTNGEDSGDLNLTAPLSANQTISLLGAGAANTIIDANQIDRVMHIATGRTATITGVTLRNGFTALMGGGLASLGTVTLSYGTLSGNEAYEGGGIYNQGILILVNSTLSQNNTDDSGGGLLTVGTATVISSTISLNDAGYDGGGIYNGGTLTVSQSTISGNQAVGVDVTGGGIYNVGGLSIVNSTLSQNYANGDGGGILNYGTANIYNTTIVFNGADADADVGGGNGGGVYNDVSGTLNLRNSLVAGNNVANAPLEDECYGTLRLYGVNVMGLSAAGVSNCTLLDFGVWTYLSAIATLGELQNNGGPTWTHALLPGSDAIDGDSLLPMACVDANGPLVTDQRGQPRVAGAQCDVGAFEYQLPLFLPLVVR